MKNVFSSDRLARFSMSFYCYAIPVLVWMMVIFLLSDQPSLGVAGQHISLPYLLLRKGAHVAEYFILGVLSFRLFDHGFPRNSHIAAAGMLLLSLPFAISDEAHQLFVTGRQGRVSDIVIDAFGIFLALVFSLGMLRHLQRQKGSLRK